MATIDVQNILSKATSLSPDQLKTVLAGPSNAGATSIGEVLNSKEFSTADELVSNLCKEMGLDFIKDIPVNDISVDLIRHLPINYAKSQSILPFREEPDQLIALTSNPVNTRALDDLRIIFGKK